MEHLWNWSKVNATGGMGYPISGLECCTYFEKDLWFELVKIMQMKHRSIIQDHVNYIHNYIVKPFRVVIIHYSERVHNMHDLVKYLPTPSMKGRDFDEADWDAHGK